MREAFRLERARKRSFGLDSTLSFAAILLGALMLSWPMIVNHGPFFLSDTTSYVRGADAAFYRLTGIGTDWTDRYQSRFEASAAPKNGNHHIAPAKEQQITLSGRSVYYGVLLYVCDRIAGLSMAAALQALLVAACLYLTVARFSSRNANTKFLVLVGILSTTTSVAYFSSYLEPDIFTALGILSAAHLMVKSPRISVPQMALWFVVACLSGLVHTSNILILAAGLAVLCLVRLRTKLVSTSGLALVFAAITVGIAGEVAFGVGVERYTGSNPVRPPFLTARLIADGPGRDYLEKTCPGSGFVLCRHLAALSGYSDDFLWSEDAANGVFSVVSSDERRAIAAEQSRFVLEVVLDRPAAVLRTSMSSVRKQSFKWGLPEFNLNQTQVEELESKLPSRIFDQQRYTLAFNDSMPVGLVDSLAFPTALLSFFAIVWAFFRRQIAPSGIIFVVTLVAGIVADVAVCGGMSTPHDRYSMRVFWLIPFAAFIVYAVIQQRGAASISFGRRRLG